jgi:hypothetical protein
VIAFGQSGPRRTSADRREAYCGIHVAPRTLSWLRQSSSGSHFQGEIKLNNVLRIVCLCLLGGFVVTAGFAHLGNVSQADRDVQVIEVTAKKYEYSRSRLSIRRTASRSICIPTDRTRKVIPASSSVRRKTAPRSKRKLLRQFNLWHVHREPTRSTAATVAELATAG